MIIQKKKNVRVDAGRNGSSVSSRDKNEGMNLGGKGRRDESLPAVSGMSPRI